MRKRMTGIILIITMLITFITLPETTVEAASKNITVKDFIKSLVININLDTSEEVSEPYIMAATKAGILKSSDFESNFSGYITRTDSAVLINRADEYLHGDTVDANLLKVVLEERISDIKQVPEEKREDIAKCFVKGIIKGYTNGYYVENRSFRGSEYLTKTVAKAYINLLTNTSKRAKLTTKGQLIRTSNLPKYAKYYPYILESFPNAYYDWKFRYEDQVRTNPETMRSVPLKNIEEYAAPVDMDKIKDFDNFTEVKNEYLEEWVSKVRTYMEGVFNVDYRTIDDSWVNKILSADYSNNNINLRTQTEKEINQYIADMKNNKTIVESSKIVVDGSSLYYCNNSYVLRVYVKYRIVSSDQKYGVDVDTLINDNPYGNVLYTRYPLVSLKSYKIGEWKEGYFDVEMAWVYNKEPSNIGVFHAILNELLYDKRGVK